MPESITGKYGAHILTLTNLDKILYPEAGITKRDFVAYYDHIADIMLPHLLGRLLTLKRFPEGIADEKEFYQKQAPEYFPDWINKVRVDLKEAGPKTLITCENRETLVYLANLASIPHIWLSRVDRLRYPDRLIFDFDPPTGAPGHKPDFEPVRYAALIMRELLKKAGMESFVMTTGSRGLHVTVPLDRASDFDEARQFARALARVLVTMEPAHFTMEFSIAKRGDKIFIDTNRNAFAQTAVAPYAVREYPGAPIAAPLAWAELEDKKLNSRSYNIKNISRRSKTDPWKAIFTKGFSVKKARQKLGL